MGKNQCVHCGHITTGFENHEFECRARFTEGLINKIEKLSRENAELRLQNDHLHYRITG